MQLSYKDDNDRCYGAAGMAIGLVVFDGEDMIAGMSVDAPAHAMMEMTGDFFFNGNPALSAKSVWNRMLRNFNLMTAMIIGNTMCRRVVYEGGAMDSALRRLLLDTVLDEGASACSLERDEAENLFNKDYSYLQRVFAHRGVCSLAHEFARTIASERSMSRADILEALRGLSML